MNSLSFRRKIILRCNIEAFEWREISSAITKTDKSSQTAIAQCLFTKDETGKHHIFGYFTNSCKPVRDYEDANMNASLRAPLIKYQFWKDLPSVAQA